MLWLTSLLTILLTRSVIKWTLHLRLLEVPFCNSSLSCSGKMKTDQRKEWSRRSWLRSPSEMFAASVLLGRFSLLLNGCSPYSSSPHCVRVPENTWQWITYCICRKVVEQFPVWFEKLQIFDSVKIPAQNTVVPESLLMRHRMLTSIIF